MHLLKFIPALFLVFLVALESRAQHFSQFGNGTDTSSISLYSPLLRQVGTPANNRYNRSNFLLTSTEIAAAGIPPGSRITGISFNKTNPTNYPGYSFYHSILIANSTASTPLSTSTNWTDILNTHRRVYTDSSQQMPANPGWVFFNFDSSLLYSGQNLSIATEQDWSVNQVFNASEATNWQFTSSYEDLAVGNLGSSPPTVLSGSSPLLKRRPNVRIFFTLPSGTDAALLSIVSPINQAYPNTQLPVSVTFGNVASNLISSLTLNYQINNGNIITENWTGNLTSGNHTNFQFNMLLNVPGTPNFNLKVWISNVNGAGLDQVRSNDTIMTSFCTALSNPNYTIGGIGADFPDLQTAFNQIVCGGINGNVTLTLMQSETGSFVLNSFSSNSGSTLTITSNSSNITLSNAGTSNLLVLNQVINVVISNLVLVRSGAPTIAQDLLQLTNTNSVTITGCTFQGFSGIASSANRLVHIIGSSNTIVRANTFNNGHFGLYATTGLNGMNSNLLCADNSINNYTDVGINIIGTNISSTIINNTLTNSIPTGVSGVGIQVGAGSLLTISENQILGNIGSMGIQLNDFTGDSLAPNRIINNVIAGDFSGLNPNAIRLSAVGTGTMSDFVFIAYNSILVKTASTSTATSGTIHVFGGATTSPTCNGIRFFNNVIKAISTAPSGSLPANYRVFYFSSEYYLDSVFLSNHNHFDFPNPGGFAEQLNPQLSISSLANWQNLTSNDLNSQIGDPLFSSVSGNNLMPLINSPLNNVALPIAGISTDVVGNSRSSTTPDIGAFEIQTIVNSMIAVAIDTPLIRLIPNSSQQVRVRYLNGGTNVITSLQLNYRYANMTIVTETWTGQLAPGMVLSYTFSTPFPVGSPIGYQSLAVWSSQPNGLPDANISNDSLKATYCVALPGGTYTVGSPTSTFPSVVDFISFLNCSGVYGPVTINFEFPNNLYTGGKLAFSGIPGTSMINTITLNGQGDTVRYNSTNVDRAIIDVQGTNNIIIRDFVLQTSNTTVGHGIYLLNADDIRIIHNVIDLRLVNTSIATSFNGILASGSQSMATSTNFNRLVIDSNLILGAGHGIRLFGSPTTYSENIVIKNNQIINFYNSGIYISNIDSGILENNDISRPNRTTTTTFQGINLESNNQGIVVRNNRIHNSHGSASALNSAAQGILVGNNGNLPKRNRLYNNLIYNFQGTGNQVGILLNNADNLDIFFNTISLDDILSSSGAARGIYMQAWCRSINILNNNISVTKGGTGEKQAIYLERDTTIFSSNHNNLYANSSTGIVEVVHFGANGFVNLANWQAAAGSSYDQNSIAAFPNFQSLIQGDLTPRNVILNAAALPIQGIQTDFYGNNRSTTPDIGAIEFSPPGIDMRMASLLSHPGNGCISSLQSIVRIRVNNVGSATVTNVPVFYKLNSNPMVADTIAGNIQSAGVVDYTFSSPMQLRNGLDTLVIWLVQDGDQFTANDSLWFYFNNYQLTILNVAASFDFENGQLPYSLCNTTGDSARVTVLGNVGTNIPLNGNFSLAMLGSTTGLPWTAPLINNWWTINPHHLSNINIYVRADTLQRLELTFNLRQLFRSAASANNFRLLINDVERIAIGQTTATLRPANLAASALSLPLKYDLSGDVGDTIKITFQASVRYNEFDVNPQAVLIDNILLRQPVTIGFDSITQVQNSCQPSPKLISAVLDTLLPLSSVNLSYRLNNGTPNFIPMNRSGNSRWSVTLPAQAVNTSVTYRIIATDIAGNTDSSLTNSFIESPLTINAGQDQTITIGNSATLIASSTGVFLTGSLPAILSGGLGVNNGAISMNVQALKNIILDTITTRIYGTIGSTAHVSVWYKTSPITSGPVNVVAPIWTEHLSNFPITVVANGPSGALPLTTFIIPPLPIPAGSTYGLVVSVNGASMGFTNYLAINPTFFYDGNMMIETGPNAGFGGNLPLIQANTRQFNGRLGYRFPDNISWSIAGSNLNIGFSDTLIVAPTRTTAYVATASSLGCVKRDTVVVFLAPFNNPDLTIKRISEPASGFLTISSPLNLSVVVHNDGDQPASGYTLQITANGIVIGSQTVSGTLTVGDSILINFPQLWNPTSGGYNICATVTNPVDPNPTNNQLCQSTSISNVTSVDENYSQSKLQVTVYPNPSHDKVYLAFSPFTEDLKVLITSITGNLVYEAEIGPNDLDSTHEVLLTKFNPGIYLLRVIEKSGRQSIIRFVISR